MKCLYLSLINIDLEDGYNRKAAAQLKAFKSFGWKVHIICHRGSAVAHGEFIDKTIDWLTVTDPINNIISRRLCLFWKAYRSILKNPPELVYIRYPRADFLFALFLAMVRISRSTSRLIAEIPTYPFNKELPKLRSLKSLIILFGEFFFRPVVTCAVSAYAVVAYNGNIFGKRSIRIENGIDEFNLLDDRIPRQLNVIDAVFIANFSENNRRHGIDRLLEGLRQYKKIGCGRTFRLNIVGDVSLQNDIFEKYQGDIGYENLVFHGRLNFNELRTLYRKMHLGIGCLGFHRIGVSHTSALKEREYLSFGMPIVVSAHDFSFDEDFPYRLKLPADETSVDIQTLINFVDSCYGYGNSRSVIRDTALVAASWSTAMSEIKRFFGEH